MDSDGESEQAKDDFLRQKTADHLLHIAKVLQLSCPPASRFYMSSLERKSNDLPDKMKNKIEKLYCHHCGSIWNLDNSKIGVEPRPLRNRHIKFLQKIEASQPWKLNYRQKKKLKKFYESTNKIVFKCKICKKKTSYPGSKSWSKSRPEYTSTPVSKVKLKKGDLNAGLFIPSPTLNSSERSNLEDQTSVTVAGTSSVSKSTVESQNESIAGSEIFKELNTSSQNANNSLKLHASINCPPKNSVSSVKQPNRRKQTLLSQILKQENTTKKKSSLSSFLVSL